MNLFYFNPRTREGCDDDTNIVRIPNFIISIHAPVKGATNTTTNYVIMTSNFNPRTREGCDV